ncbi:MAG: GrpB family protein [Chthoniobacteraceae bacterium]
MGDSERLHSFRHMLTDHSLAHAIVEEIRIAAHDSRWAAQFVAERERLLDLLPGHFAAIEHIGSTAVPRLAAKPIIDILGGVNTISEADALLEPLCAHGYETSAGFNATLPDKRWLMRHAFGRRTHHLHLVVFGGEQWVQRLQFRDVLRADPAIAARYEHLKQELAEQHRHDREAYTHAKAAFINEVLTNVSYSSQPTPLRVAAAGGR